MPVLPAAQAIACHTTTPTQTSLVPSQPSTVAATTEGLAAVAPQPEEIATDLHVGDDCSSSNESTSSTSEEPDEPSGCMRCCISIFRARPSQLEVLVATMQTQQQQQQLASAKRIAHRVMWRLLARSWQTWLAHCETAEIAMQHLKRGVARLQSARLCASLSVLILYLTPVAYR